MVIGCLLALIIGGLASLAMPLMAFVLAIMLVVALGGVAALVLLPVTMTGFVAGAAMFAASQIGYGLGLALIGVTGWPPARKAAQRRVRTGSRVLRHHTPPDN